MSEDQTVNGWCRSDTEHGDLRYDSDDRKATIICTRVETHGGEVFNCRLYESEEPHGYGVPETSEIAEEEDDIGRVVRELDGERSG